MNRRLKNVVTHRPGQIAPMSLLTYESARPWAKAMKSAVLERKIQIRRFVTVGAVYDRPR